MALRVLGAEEGIPEKGHGMCKGPGSSGDREPPVQLGPKAREESAQPGKNSALHPVALVRF